MTTSSSAIEHRIGSTGDFELRFGSGEVRVSASPDEMARVRDAAGRDLWDQFTIEQTTGGLHIHEKDRVRGLGLRQRDAVELVVEVPPAARVSIETASAEVRAHGLTGDQHYHTASGEITLEAVSGAIRLDAVSGDADLRLDGEVNLEARLVSGDIAVAGSRLASATLQTTSGDISLRTALPGPGPYAIKTVSGDADLVTADDLRIDVATVTGSVVSTRSHRTEAGNGRRVLAVGAGSGAELAFKSISGDLRVEAPGSASVSEAERIPPKVTADAELELRTQAGRTGTTNSDDERLSILRDLEQGRIDVAEATARLALVEGAD